MKTENANQVGKHAFEIAGLGIAPFRFIGASENKITYPDGTSKAGGSCAYCGTGIMLECHIKSSDGKNFKVGCDCVRKVGDEGILQAYKTSVFFRNHQRAVRQEKAKKVSLELARLITENETLLKSQPHPKGFLDRVTNEPLTLLDQWNWYIGICGAAGRAKALPALKRALDKLKNNSNQVLTPAA